jgi:hypothetical protein
MQNNRQIVKVKKIKGESKNLLLCSREKEKAI